MNGSAAINVSLPHSRMTQRVSDIFSFSFFLSGWRLKAVEGKNMKVDSVRVKEKLAFSF